jgi:hypothetical protein
MYKFQTIYDNLYSSTRIKHLKPGDVIIYCNKLAVVLVKTNLKRTTKMVLLQNLKTETAIYHKDYDFNKLNKHNVNHVKI